MRARKPHKLQPDGPSAHDFPPSLGYGMAVITVAAVFLGLLALRKNELHDKMTWSHLNDSARASLFVKAASSGRLASGLQACAEHMLVDSFGGEGGMRGAKAVSQLRPGFICAVSDDGLLSVATVRSMMGDAIIKILSSSRVGGDEASVATAWNGGAAESMAESLSRQPADDRALMAVLFLREAAKAHSPLMPYIQSFLHLPEGVPAGWDTDTDEGAARRAQLREANPRAMLMADVQRRLIARKYDSLVPAAIRQTLETGMPLGGPEADTSREALDRIYSLARFREVWLAIASRDFTNSLQSTSRTPLDRGHPFPTTFLAPLIDLMNHGGTASNVDVRYDPSHHGFVMAAKRTIRAGEELRFSYGSNLCVEQALMLYGFEDEEMRPCPPPGGARPA